MVARTKTDGDAIETEAERRKRQTKDHRGRLRDRVLEDCSGLQDYELLEYLLFIIPRVDTKGIAKDLIEEFGSLSAVFKAAPEELKRVDKIGDVAAATIKVVEAIIARSLRLAANEQPVLSGWLALTDYLHATMAHRMTEEFRVIFLNGHNIMIKDQAMGQGTVNAAPVYPREIVKRATELGAVGLILVHNHPSGNPQPSKDDIVMTKAIIEAGRHMGLKVIDHVIISRSGPVSMRSQGLIN